MKKLTKQSRSRHVVDIIGSKRFFFCIVALFIFEAAWIALSGRYPMAFDEDFHLGIIRLYAHHISPFWNSQPAGANAYGAIARDPSYLYQYLMSFPYRLISAINTDQTIQVIWLRAINIGLFASALPLYKRLLLKMGASRAMVNVCLLLFALVPIAPFLAAQINYDNLLLPLVALSLIWTLRLSDELQEKHHFNLGRFLGLLTLCLLTSLVKYAFLPIFGGIMLFLAVRLWLTYRSVRLSWVAVIAGWSRISSRARWMFVALLLLSAGLFAQRYAVNVIRYGEPIPDCSQVLSVKQCSNYGPWIRDYNDKIANVGGKHSPFIFTADWFYGMWLRSFFAVDGPATDFQTRGPLMVPALASIILPGAALLLAIIYFRRYFQQDQINPLALLVVVSGCYVGTLWLDEYRSFLSAGQPVAINGRYLLPIFPLILIIGAKAYSYLFKSHQAKLALATLAVFCMLLGGGALTYILRSYDEWYWPNPAVQDANNAVKKVFGPITPGYDKPTAYLR